MLDRGVAGTIYRVAATVARAGLTSLGREPGAAEASGKFGESLRSCTLPRAAAQAGTALACLSLSPARLGRDAAKPHGTVQVMSALEDRVVFQRDLFGPREPGFCPELRGLARTDLGD